MLKFIIMMILIFVFGFGQINWEMETVDTSPGMVGYSNSLAFDINDIPHIIYAITQVDTNLIMHAFKTDSYWQKETVDVCFAGGPYWGLPYYGVSLTIGDDNRLHSSFYRYDSLNNRTDLCYAYRDTLLWTIQVLDSMAGTISWVPGYHTSIVLDTSGYPGIAYSYWNFTDSVQYIKYLHYNGVNWNSFIVEDSCVCWDYGVSLKIDKRNQPHIAYYQLDPDSMKYVYYDNQLNTWVIAYHQDVVAVNSNASLSLVLNSQNHPGIAYSFQGESIVYSWFDGTFWYTDFVGGAGFWEVAIGLDLDSLENPHIAYTVEFNFWLEYAYKDTVWHLCGPHYGAMGNVCLKLNGNSNPHVSYDGGLLNYAWGSFAGVVEKQLSPRNKKCRIRVFPNISSGVLNTEYTLPVKTKIELSLYDIYGAKIKIFENSISLPGSYQKMIDISSFSNGVYFIVLKQNNEQVARKFLLIK
ncbi:MAG TPA: T9SS type A sorting domain-containing protein [candidate division WOR-3 bacterium]|uniref:T9SS type A sorting domain-containing protein n=1 Tax=candidate division WOR-3 bacterium TaxID=2052148 RepID=A0A9C9EPD1_UNCW3|nr:T9SS type A sorting domain-containing protein [candidate division WOR-3 bacterium]